MEKSSSKLELVWRTRIGDEMKTRRDYLDFIIDGKSLGDILKIGDFIGCLGWLKSESDKKFSDELLLNFSPELESGRCQLYICPECADIGCGAYTAHVQRSEEDVIWKDFGYEDDLHNAEPDLEKYKNIRPFSFKWTEYQKVLSGRPNSTWKKED